MVKLLERAGLGIMGLATALYVGIVTIGLVTAPSIASFWPDPVIWFLLSGFVVGAVLYLVAWRVVEEEKRPAQGVATPVPGVTTTASPASSETAAVDTSPPSERRSSGVRVSVPGLRRYGALNAWQRIDGSRRVVWAQNRNLAGWLRAGELDGWDVFDRDDELIGSVATEAEGVALIESTARAG